MIAKDIGEVQHAKDKREHTEYDGTYVNRAGPHWLGPSCSAVFGSLCVLLHIFERLVMVWIESVYTATVVFNIVVGTPLIP
jgi:hypothetical protein